MSTTGTARRRTLWEEGRQPGRLVTHVAVLAAAGLVALDLALTHEISWLFDVGFVLVCVAAALAVRPRDFFPVGVLPPLLMAAVVLALALFVRTAVADAEDGLVQSFVSGLAHHAGALVTGDGLTLVVLALRQVALRNAGTLRGHRPRAGARRPQPGLVGHRDLRQVRRPQPVVPAPRTAPEMEQVAGGTAPHEAPRRSATGR
ncbi:MAG: DUF6542 domain-containing protein [Nocardioides sp.]